MECSHPLRNQAKRKKEKERKKKEKKKREPPAYPIPSRGAVGGDES
tara:strand:+ start:450 stop:587 length:138 start_codon:yes stop_codon:yes gene_type:complete